MNKESVEAFVTSAQSSIDDSPQMDEANTKAAILRDFIELLGWQIPANTELEYSVNALGQTYKVDYALLIEDRPVAFLEAKGLENSLTDKHRQKLRDYLQSEDVNLGILSNGQQYEFYRREIDNSEVITKEVGSTTLQDLPERTRVLEAYQPSKIRSEEWEVIIEQVQGLRKSWEVLNQEKQRLATKMVSVLTDQMPDAIEPKAEPRAKEMVDRVIDDIESEIDVDSTDIADSDSAPTQTELNDQSTERSDQYYVSITREGDTVETFEDSVQSDLMASVVNYLIADHDLLSAIEPLPYIPGKTRAIVNDTPTYNDGEMAQPREVTEGHHVELNLSWGQKKREMRRMADACELKIDIDEFEADE